MLSVYNILRYASKLKSRRIKLFGLWVMHVLGRRYIGIFLDPVLACNLRCKMCYFSDAEKRKSYKGIFDYKDIEKIAKALFHRALKLQIGCGAEPTLYKELVQIIALGKRYNVPYISLTTNGNLLRDSDLSDMVAAGLNEITLSVHGFTKETYEYLMENGNFEVFRQLLKNISSVKKQYPDFKLRINYTINNDNLNELRSIWNILSNDVDVLQLRPIQNIGNSKYTDFDLANIYNEYEMIILPIIEECKKRNIVCLVPNKKNLLELGENEESDNLIEQSTYCYVSPRGCWKDDFDFHTETFESYARKHHLGKTLLSNVFRKKTRNKTDVSRKLNYIVK